MPTQQQIAEALRSDPDFQAATDSYLMVSLVLAHGRQAERKGVSFGDWLGRIEALLQEYVG